MQHQPHHYNHLFGPDRLDQLPIAQEDLFARIREEIDDPPYRGTIGQNRFIENVDVVFARIDTWPDLGLSDLVRHITCAAWDLGGIDVFGRHWCTDHRHRAEPSPDPAGPGTLRIAASASVRSLHFTEWTVTLHQPCCPRTLSGDIQTATLTLDAARDWAQQLADQHTLDDPNLNWDAEQAKGMGNVATCCCITTGERPIDIIYLEGDALAERWWRLLRDQRFEVRIANECHNAPTYDERDPVPGHRCADIWQLRQRGDLVELEAPRYEEVVGRFDEDEERLTANLMHLIGVLRR